MMLPQLQVHLLPGEVVQPRVVAASILLKRLDDALSRTIWAHPGMTTYYRNSQGRVVTTMPWTNVEFREMTREPNLEDFHVRHVG